MFELANPMPLPVYRKALRGTLDKQEGDSQGFYVQSIFFVDGGVSIWPLITNYNARQFAIPAVVLSYAKSQRPVRTHFSRFFIFFL